MWFWELMLLIIFFQVCWCFFIILLGIYYLFIHLPTRVRSIYYQADLGPMVLERRMRSLAIATKDHKMCKTLQEYY